MTSEVSDAVVLRPEEVQLQSSPAKAQNTMPLTNIANIQNLLPSSPLPLENTCVIKDNKPDLEPLLSHLQQQIELADCKPIPPPSAPVAAGPSKKTDTMSKEPPQEDTCVESCKAGWKSGGCPIRGKWKPAGGWNLSCREVHRRLEALGVDAKNASLCVKAAIMKGFIKITGEDMEELNQVVLSEPSGNNGLCTWECGHPLNATLGDLLKQPDYAGTDYESGLEDATVVCKVCKENPEVEEGDEGRTYVSRICEGKPEFDSGKSHNHCKKCPGFGMCIYDYRERHCNKCKKHYFRGFIKRYPCSCGHTNSDSEPDLWETEGINPDDCTLM